MYRRAIFYLLLGMSGHCFGQASFQYELLHPKFFLHGRNFIDSSGFKIQLRTAGANCVEVLSPQDALDTSFYTPANSVATLSLQSGYGAFSNASFTLPMNEKISVQASQPLAVSVYWRTDLPADPLAPQMVDSLCREQNRAEATDLLPTSEWGSKYMMAPAAGTKRFGPTHYLGGTFLASDEQIFMAITHALQNTPIRISHKGNYVFGSLGNQQLSCLLANGPGRVSLSTDSLVALPAGYQLLFFLPQPMYFLSDNGMHYNDVPIIVESLNGEKFEAVVFNIQFSSDSTGHFHMIEAQAPVSRASQKLVVSRLHHQDTMVAAVTFMKDSTWLLINGDTAGIFSSDSIHRFKYTENIILEAGRPIQAHAATQPADLELQGTRTGHFLRRNYIGTGFRSASEAEFIRKTVFQPVVPEDSSALPFVHITCRTSSVSQMKVNGKLVPQSSFSAYLADGDLSAAVVPLHRDSVYVLENQDGFMAVHYSVPNDTSGFVGLYSMLLTETYELSEEDRRMGYRRETDSTFATAEPALLCQEQGFWLRPPLSGFTTWVYSLPDGSVIKSRTEGEGDSIWLQADWPLGNHQIIACDAAGCLPCDTLDLLVERFQPSFNASISEQGCDEFILHLSAYPTLGADYFWTVMGDSVGKGAELRFVIPSTSSAEVQVALHASNGACDTVITQIVPLPVGAGEGKFNNIFTPNGDGVNDCYSPMGQSSGEACFSFNVYNRWGQLVWHSKASDPCWDGKIDGGEAPEGVYYFVLTKDGEGLSGHFTLVR